MLLLIAAMAVAALAVLDSEVVGYWRSQLSHRSRQSSGKPDAGVLPEQILVAAYDEADQTFTLLAAGDIAECYGGKLRDNAAARTATLAEEWPLDPVLAPGDLVYYSGTPADFATCFDPLWEA